MHPRDRDSTRRNDVDEEQDTRDHDARILATIERRNNNRREKDRNKNRREQNGRDEYRWKQSRRNSNRSKQNGRNNDIRQRYASHRYTRKRFATASRKPNTNRKVPQNTNRPKNPRWRT